jgi:radical SAM protein with 4Fe4S-binding SPASM domain
LKDDNNDGNEMFPVLFTIFTKRYCLPKRVILVRGTCGACLYDLRQPVAILYKLDAEAVAVINKLLSNKFIPETPSIRQLLVHLLTNGLLQEDSHPETTDTVVVTPQKRAAWIEVTNRCQLKCVFCYGEFGGRNCLSMDLKSAYKAINELLENDFFNLCIIGGEPLLEESLVRAMVHQIHAMPAVTVEIFTNGLLLSKNFIDFCQQHEVRLALGLYGANRSECKNVTGVASVYDQQKKVFRMIEASGIPYRVSITRNRYNNSVSLMQLASIYGIPHKALREDHARSAGRGRSLDLKELGQQKFTITEDVFRRSILSDKILRRMQGGHNCFASKVCISPSLDVYPCIMERSISYGNLSYSSLETILEFAKPYRNAGKDNIISCRQCEYRYACFDCRAQRKSDSNFLAKPDCCAYNPEVGIWSK